MVRHSLKLTLFLTHMYVWSKSDETKSSLMKTINVHIHYLTDVTLNLARMQNPNNQQLVCLVY